MKLAPFFELRSGAAMPSIGYGTWKLPADIAATNVRRALDTGYRHIDAAARYGNQTEVGKGIHDSGIGRDDIFVTSKLWSDARRPELVEKSAKESIAQLKCEYLDLYLIHWPFALKPGTNELEEIPIEKTWEAMLQLKKSGLVKAVGVSNFSRTDLKKLLKAISKEESWPEVHQLETHAYLPQNAFVAENQHRGIHVSSYSPLADANNTYAPVHGSGKRLIEHPRLVGFAKDRHMTPAQVLLAYNLSRGLSVLPKSCDEHHMKENLETLNFKFSDKDALALENLVFDHIGHKRLNTSSVDIPQFSDLDN